MSVSNDIVAMYRRPKQVFARLYASGQREDRALVFLIVACLLMFVAQTPRLAREAHMQDQDFNMLMGGALMGWLFIVPLAAYALAMVTRLIAMAFGGRGAGWQSRLALFWAMLASSPLFLLVGLVQGFIGRGLEATLVGVVWLFAFLVFWGAGLWQGERGTSA